MDQKARVIVWDHDRVLIPSLVTSELARGVSLSPEPFLAEMVESSWLSPADVERWCCRSGRRLERISDLADFLTDCLYELSGADGDSLLSKPQVMTAKQRLLRGLTVAQIYKTVRETPLTQGITGLIEKYRKQGRRQIILSDTLEIAVRYQAERLGMTAGFGVQAVLNLDDGDGVDCPLSPLEERDSPWPLKACLTGKVLPFSKAQKLWTYCLDHRVDLLR